MGEPKAGTDADNEADEDPAGSATPSRIDGEQVSLGDSRIEVDCLAYETCRRVADAIGRQCAPVAAQGPMLVGPVGISSLLFQGRALAASLDAVRTELLAVAAKAAGEAAAAVAAGTGSSAQGQALEADRRTVRERATAATASVIGSLTGLGSIVTSAAAVLDGTVKIATALGITETRVARDTVVGDDMAATLVAAALRRHGARPRLASSFSSLGAARSLRILEDVAAATAKLRAVSGSQSLDGATQLLARVDELVSGAQTAQGAVLSLGMLQMVDGGEGSLLTVKTASAGGVYRVRRSLLSWLGIKDPLTASGGAALAWALTDIRSGEMLAGDLSFEIGDPVQSPRVVDRRRIGNLTDAPEHRTALSAPARALPAPIPEPSRVAA